MKAGAWIGAGRSMTQATPNSRLPYSKFYYGLRIVLHKNERILRVAQMLRALLLLGPLKVLIVQGLRVIRTNKPFAADLTSVFPSLDTKETVAHLDRSGYAHVGILAEPAVRQILEYCEARKRVRYWNPHKECDAVDRISRDARIVEIAREYLGVEPILWLTQLRWTVPSSKEGVELFPSAHAEPD